MLLELHGRLGRVGLADESCFAMPLMQEALADALGFSVVHVNRTVQQLRRDRLLDVRNGTVLLMQRQRVRDLAGWTPPARASRPALTGLSEPMAQASQEARHGAETWGQCCGRSSHPPPHTRQ